MLALALAAPAGCTSTSDATASTEQQLSSTAAPTFVARPSQRLLFTAKAKVAAATAETFIQTKVFPLLKRESRVGDITTYVDAKGTYFVEVELRTISRPQLSLAIDVFSIGRTPADAQALIAEASGYFDVTATKILTRRNDLSIVRNPTQLTPGGVK